MVQAEQTLQEVLNAFDFGAPVVGAIRYGQGHINDTFCVHTQPEDACGRRFILQRMSAAAFKRPDQLMENIEPLKKNQYGQYLLDVLAGKYIDN